MSGILTAVMGSGAVVTTWTGSMTHINPGGSVSASISVNTAGTLTGTRYSGQSAWYTPSGGTPGNSYYVKFTATGDAWDAGLVSGTVYALTSDRSLTWSDVANQKTATLTVSIYSDSGGTNLLGTGTVTVNVNGTP